MRQFWRVVCVGVVAILVFDTLASFASEVFGFAYGYATIGSVLIYSTIGYFVFLIRGLVQAIGAALLVGLVDATLGWYIAWQIGPGVLEVGSVTAALILGTLVIVSVMATVCALVGSTAALLLHGPRFTDSQ